MTLGIPVVIGPEPATQEVAGGHAFVARDWTPDALAEAVGGRPCSATDAQLDAARAHAGTMTWAHTVDRTRAALASMVS